MRLTNPQFLLPVFAKRLDHRAELTASANALVWFYGYYPKPRSAIAKANRRREAKARRRAGVVTRGFMALPVTTYRKG